MLGKCFLWLRRHPKTLAGLIVVVLCVAYFPVHAYRAYADKQKFSQSRAAIDTVYADTIKTLGQPDNLNRANTCSKGSRDLRQDQTICSVSTDFIYGLDSQPQANTFLRQIQQVAAKHPELFKPTKKLSAGVSSNLVFDTYYHDALDNYSGPRGIGCTIKYSYATPDEVTLSLNNTSKQPFEVFFDCSAKTVRPLYPAPLMPQM